MGGKGCGPGPDQVLLATRRPCQLRSMRDFLVARVMLPVQIRTLKDFLARRWSCDYSDFFDRSSRRLNEGNRSFFFLFARTPQRVHSLHVVQFNRHVPPWVEN